MSTRPEWHAWAAVGVNVHVRPGVSLASTIHADEDRAVLHVEGTNSADVSLFVDRADLDRLHAAVTEARDQLATATAALDTESTDPASTGPTGAADAA